MNLLPSPKFCTHSMYIHMCIYAYIVCVYIWVCVCVCVCVYRRGQWHPTPVLLPGKSREWRSMVGCSPGGRKESDTTERLHFHFLLSCIGEGNGNPLQGSCLENPQDGWAWWAAVYGVAQSRTRLKRLSSSSVCVCVCIYIYIYTHIYMINYFSVKQTQLSLS